MWVNYLAVFIGGGLGSVFRFGVSRLITSNFQQINPSATLVANILATLLLGIMLLAGSNRLIEAPVLKALLITGFCGGFSTFSTFSYESFILLREGQFFLAVANVVISVLLAVILLYVVAQSDWLVQQAPVNS